MNGARLSRHPDRKMKSSLRQARNNASLLSVRGWVETNLESLSCQAADFRPAQARMNMRPVDYT